MRVYEAKLVYSLVSLGENVRLDSPEKVAEYLRSAFDENPMQEAFYCIYLDRKNHPFRTSPDHARHSHGDACHAPRDIPRRHRCWGDGVDRRPQPPFR